MTKDLLKNLDKLIVERLVSNSKIPVKELAKEYGVSNGTVRNRIAQLSKSNIIMGYKARARLNRLGMCEVIVGLDIAPEHYMEAIGSIKALSTVKELYRASGDHSAIAIITTDSDGVEGIISDIAAIKGVKNVYPSFVQEVVK